MTSCWTSAGGEKASILLCGCGVRDKVERTKETVQRTMRRAEWTRNRPPAAVVLLLGCSSSPLSHCIHPVSLLALRHTPLFKQAKQTLSLSLSLEKGLFPETRVHHPKFLQVSAQMSPHLLYWSTQQRLTCVFTYLLMVWLLPLEQKAL